MNDVHPRDLSLVRARTLVARAIDKAEQLHLAGGIAVMGASGALVSTSRMDRGGAGGMARARSKAWISATQQVPSAEHLARMNFVSAPVERGFVGCSPEAVFPGAGGMPIREDGRVVAGIAASGATVSPFFPADVEPEQMIADGEPANPEDLLVHYALGLPYAGQHGDDHARWDRRFGPWRGDLGPGLGMAQAPPASRQHEHEWALGLADAVIDEAVRRGVLVSVAVVDHRGDPVQQDAMDHAPSAAAFLSAAVAATAATFGVPSEDVGSRYGGDGGLAQLQAVLPHPVLTCAGGVPLELEGRLIGGLGVAGVAPGVCAEIVRAVAGTP